MNRNKRGGTLTLVIALAALALSAFTAVRTLWPAKGVEAPDAASATLEAAAEPAPKDTQYVLFLGTNDKDTYAPYGTPEVCKARVDEVLTRHFEGFTIQDAMGGWTNADGTVSHEYTVVILLSDTTADKVHAAADELIAAFNQSSVLIQTNETTTEFYDGIQ